MMKERERESFGKGKSSRKCSSPFIIVHGSHFMRQQIEIKVKLKLTRSKADKTKRACSKIFSIDFFLLHFLLRSCTLLLPWSLGLPSKRKRLLKSPAAECWHDWTNKTKPLKIQPRQSATIIQLIKINDTINLRKQTIMDFYEWCLTYKLCSKALSCPTGSILRHYRCSQVKVSKVSLAKFKSCISFK